MTEVIGRDRELQAFEHFLGTVAEGPAATILQGEPGIGKTTLWEAAVSRASQGGFRVLRAAPAEAESHLPYAALTDLMGSIPASRFADLPPPQRRALEAALLRGESTDPPAAQRAVATAVLRLIAAVSREGPVLIAIDDEQWMDSPSAAVLRFAVRRLETEPAGLILAHRVQQAGALVRELERLLPAERLHHTDLRPLDLESVDNLLLARLGRPFPRPVLDRLHALSGGNPFFALEIGRFLLRTEAHSPIGGIPIPETLKDLVRKRVNRLPARTRAALLAIAAMSQPTVELVMQATELTAEDLQPAIADDVITTRGFRLRFTHPLIGSVVYEDASPHGRRRLHGRIADVVLDTEERARHLALAATGADAGVADALDAAARTANRRGAPDAAALLAEQAADLTPADRRDDLCRRTIDAADYHLLSGDTARAQALLERLSTPDTPAAWRAPALERQAKSEFYNGRLATAESLCREALARATGDRRLAATLERDLIHILSQRGDVEGSLPHLRTLLALGESLDDPGIVAHARTMGAFAGMILGRGLLPEAEALAAGIPEAVGPGRSERNASILDPGMDMGAMLKWADNFAAARTVFKALLRRTADDREESARAPVLFHLGEMEVWAGDWLLAAVYAEECRKAVLHSGQGAYRRLALTLAGYLEACRGQAEPAKAAAGEALAQSRQISDSPYALRNLRTLGFLELSLGDAEVALRFFDPLRDELLQRHHAEPGIHRYDADRIEALIAVGRVAEAEAHTAWLEERGQTLQRPWARAMAQRSRALLMAAGGNLTEALVRLDAALLAHDAFCQPLEQARTLMLKGTIERRAKQKRAARASLTTALGTFERLGATLWARRAQLELERVGGPATVQALTVTEGRVAELVALGRTNREVSQQLFMSIKTVESNLSRIYAKLAVRSRSELAANLAGRPAAGPR